MVLLVCRGYRGVLVGEDDPLDDIGFLCLRPSTPPLPPLHFLIKLHVSQHPPFKLEIVFVVSLLALPSAGPPCTQSPCRLPQRLTASVWQTRFLHHHPTPLPPAPIQLLHWGPVSPVTQANSSKYSGCRICYARDHLYFIYKILFFFKVQKLANFSSNPGKFHFECLVYLLRCIRDNNNLVLK